MNSKDKKLREYMKLPYTVMLRRDEEGDIVARIKELEGCVADGQDEMEAIGNLELVKEMWLATALDAGQAIPKPDEDGDLPSGKFLTRVPRSLHKKLIELAAEEGVSLNQLVTVSLSRTVGEGLTAAVPASQVGEILPQLHSSGEYGGICTPAALRIVSSYGVISPENESSPYVLMEEFASKSLRSEKIASPQTHNYEEGRKAIGYY